MESDLKGLFVHTIVEGKLNYQGRIIGVDGDYALVQLFSWVDGRPTVVEAWPKKSIYTSCRLYADEEAWHEAVKTSYTWHDTK